MSRGPEIQKPIHCPTIELKDLADIKGFDEDGEQGTVYGLELNESGLYERKEIEDKKRPHPRLNQVKDVEIKNEKDGETHALVKEGDKWIITVKPKEIKWGIKMEFKSPYTFTSGNIFRKSVNIQPALISLRPSKANTIGIKPFDNFSYVIHSRYPEENNSVEFNPKLSIGQQLTMVFDIQTHKIVKTMRLTDHITVIWDGQPPGTVVEDRIRIVIKKDGDNITAQTTDQYFTVTVNELDELHKIYLKDIDLIGFYASRSIKKK